MEIFGLTKTQVLYYLSAVFDYLENIKVEIIRDTTKLSEEDGGEFPSSFNDYISQYRSIFSSSVCDSGLFASLKQDPCNLP